VDEEVITISIRCVAIEGTILERNGIVFANVHCTTILFCTITTECTILKATGINTIVI